MSTVVLSARKSGPRGTVPYSGCEYELYVITAAWLYVTGGTLIYRNLKKVIQAANAWKGTGMRVFIVTKVAP